jgi:phosphate-selective porin OprO/OprP
MRLTQRSTLLLALVAIMAVHSNLPAADEDTDIVIVREPMPAIDSEGDGTTFDPPVQPACVDWACPPEEPALTYPTVKLGGFFQADVGWFNQDATSIAAVGDVQDGADFRRARLSASGDVAENINYFVEFDFGFPGRPNFTDIYMDVESQCGPGRLRLGQWRQPMGMDAMTSVKDLTFLERALPFAFVPFRQIGVGKYYGSDDGISTFAVSAMRFPTDTFGGNVGDNGGYGVVSRATIVPWATDHDRRLWHLGGAITFADPSNDLVRYRNQPEFFVSETGGADLVPAGVPSAVPPFVDTGPIDAQNFRILNLESALVCYSFHMQSELYFTSVNQLGGPVANFWGAYAQAGYILTGETRPYLRNTGVLGRIVPNEPYDSATGPGAWEIAARLSTLDLADVNVAGGRLTDLTLGLNWYLARNAKCQFNYIHALLDSPGLGHSDNDIFAGRAQVDF